jgi:hypothetical protein
MWLLLLQCNPLESPLWFGTFPLHSYTIPLLVRYKREVEVVLSTPRAISSRVHQFQLHIFPSRRLSASRSSSTLVQLQHVHALSTRTIQAILRNLLLLPSCKRRSQLGLQKE